MYAAILAAHSLFRYVVLAAGIAAIAFSARGWREKRPFRPADARAGFIFTLCLDIQILVGLLLYFVFSPITKIALHNFGAAMKDSTLRFWAVEHAFSMLVALTVAHVTRVLIKRTADARRKHRRAFIGFTLAMIAIFVGIPWPFLKHGRALLPGM